MNYSFMSFSCPEATLAQLLETAARFGYDGIEPRAGSGHAHGVELTADAAARARLRRQVADSGLRLACLAVSCRYADPATSAAQLEDTLRYLELAADIGAPRLRVFGGALPAGVSRAQAADLLVDALSRAAAKAMETGVTICIETHDHWCDPADLAAVLDRVGNPRVLFNWDIMHPVRVAGKTIDEAWAIVRGRVGHVHFHDGVTTAAGKLDLRPIGQGDIDHRRAVQLLEADGYAGFLSGEWINWAEPWETYLPRELATMRSYGK